MQVFTSLKISCQGKRLQHVPEGTRDHWAKVLSGCLSSVVRDPADISGWEWKPKGWWRWKEGLGKTRVVTRARQKCPELAGLMWRQKNSSMRTTWQGVVAIPSHTRETTQTRNTTPDTGTSQALPPSDSDVEGENGHPTTTTRTQTTPFKTAQ